MSDSPSASRVRSTAALWTMAGAMALSVAASFSQPTLLVWNGSRSAPLGLYRRAVGTPQRGDWVLASLPLVHQQLIMGRHYLPEHVPLIKQVGAVRGDVVCRSDNSITINHRIAATALSADQQHSPLPTWSGCRQLTRGQLFLLNPHPRSLDGRYFGVTDRASIKATLSLVWEQH